MNPYFSIIIPAYNRAPFLAKAVNSILAQTFTDFEIIVVDDASTDNTREVIAVMNHPKVHYLRNEKNMERCVSRNKGIDAAHGKYICFLDSDDYYLPEHLQTFYDAIKEHGESEALFFTNAFESLENGIYRERKVPPFQKDNPFGYILTYTFNPARVCVHKAIFENFKFDPQIPGIEDFDLWLRIATRFPVIHIPKNTCVYVLHSESYTAGDSKRAHKDYRSYKIVFRKPELQGKLPRAERWRLLSMCHYFFAVEADRLGEKINAIKHAIASFFLCPRGYNGKTNKILLVICLYNIPLLGSLLKMLVRRQRQLKH